MNRAQKTELANELKDSFSKASVAIFSDYKGLPATDADQLRRQLRPLNAKVRVIKNNVARLVCRNAAMGAEAESLMDELVGPTMVTFAMEDPSVVAKVLNKFAQDNEAFLLKDSLMGQKRVDVSGIEALANLPSKEVLLGTLLSTMNAPVSNFVGVLAAVPRSLVTVLSAIEKKKAEVQA